MAFTGKREIRPRMIPSSGSYLRIKCGMIPNPWSFSRLFLLISFALQAWAGLNLIPGFNLDALEKGMSPARRWKNLEAPAGGNLWISCVFLGGFLGWEFGIFTNLEVAAHDFLLEFQVLPRDLFSKYPCFKIFPEFWMGLGISSRPAGSKAKENLGIWNSNIPTFQIFPAPSFGETGLGVEIPVYPDPDDISRIGNREQGLGIPGFSRMRLEMPLFPGIW